MGALEVSLANTKGRKHAADDIIGREFSAQTSQFIQRTAQTRSDEFDIRERRLIDLRYDA